jgi:hypothetical protein
MTRRQARQRAPGPTTDPNTVLAERIIRIRSLASRQPGGRVKAEGQAEGDRKITGPQTPATEQQGCCWQGDCTAASNQAHADGYSVTAGSKHSAYPAG